MRRSEAKRAVTLRLRAALVDEFREFVRDNAGKPMYLTPATFVEEAIEKHLELLRRSVESAEVVGGTHNNQPSKRR